MCPYSANYRIIPNLRYRQHSTARKWYKMIHGTHSYRLFYPQSPRPSVQVLTRRCRRTKTFCRSSYVRCAGARSKIRGSVARVVGTRYRRSELTVSAAAAGGRITGKLVRRRHGVVFDGGGERKHRVNLHAHPPPAAHASVPDATLQSLRGE